MAFAEGTDVPVARSRAEIETLLMRYGADQFASGYDPKRAVIQFRAKDRRVRFTIALPDPQEHRFTHVKHAQRYFEQERTELQARKAYEQECRRLWRALVLVVKAKLEAVESGIATFDAEFMPFIVMPDGKTVGEHVIPAIEQAYTTGKMPPLLPGLGESSAL